MHRFKLLFLLLFVVASLLAQDLSKLTPEQMEMYKQYTSGKSITAGVPQKTALEDKILPRELDENDSALIVPDKKNQKAVKLARKTPEELKLFGSYLFSTQNLTFEPKLNIPTPSNYILGLYDELIIDVSGLYEASYKLKVSPEGFVRIPNVGPVKVSGLTITSATNQIKNAVSNVFSGINTGETKLNISLGNIRSIRVTVVGEAVRPGTYTLPSLASAFNAIYACGGPNDIGTMRDIKVIRSGKVVATIDVYKYIIDGVLLNNIVLQDEDIIRFDPYKIRTTITGAFKRNAYFEATENESLLNMIQYAGGFADNAFKDRITVFRVTQNERMLIDVEKSSFSSFKLASGDSLVVRTSSDRFDNKIDIVGAVVRPGSYALDPGLTVKQLINKAGGIQADAFMNIAYIKRKKLNKIPENLGFNLGELLKDELKDIPLQKDDTVEIKNILDFTEKMSVSIVGPVRSPGTFELIENTKLKDLIFQAGGFNETAACDSIELVRIIKDPVTLITTNEKSTIQKFALDEDLNVLNGGDSIVLRNGDRVIVRKIPGYEDIRMVRVEGEVLRPGSYNIRNKEECISDVLKRTGGFTNYAYREGAFLIRSESIDDIERKLNKMMINNSKNQLQNQSDKKLDQDFLQMSGVSSAKDLSSVDSIKNTLSGTKVIDEMFQEEGIVGLNLTELMKSPGGKHDLKLENNDIIYIPREQQTVRVLGQVLFPTIVRYDKAISLRDYINNSGGFSINASKYKVFVLYANGNVKSTRSFLGIRKYPRVEPGARIIVPERPIEIKRTLTTGENIAIFSTISSSIALIYSVVKK